MEGGEKWKFHGGATQWAKSGEEDAIHGFEKAGLHILSREEQEEEEKIQGK